MQYWGQPSLSATLCNSDALTQMLAIYHESESITLFCLKAFTSLKKFRAKNVNFFYSVFDICLNTSFLQN